MLTLCVCALTLTCNQATGPQWVQSADFPRNLQEKLLAATVRMIVPNNNNSEATAVRIKRVPSGRVYFLTAAHALGSAKEVNLEGYKSASYPKVELSLKYATVKQRWDEIDLALLEAGEDDVHECINIVPESKIPAEKQFAVLTLGCSNGDPPVFVLDRVVNRKRVHKPDGTSGWYWLTEKKPDEGRSGGPMISKSGFLIGICSGTEGDHGFYVDSQEIRRAARSFANFLLELDKPVGKDR